MERIRAGTHAEATMYVRFADTCMSAWSHSTGIDLWWNGKGAQNSYAVLKIDERRATNECACMRVPVRALIQWMHFRRNDLARALAPRVIFLYRTCNLRPKFLPRAYQALPRGLNYHKFEKLTCQIECSKKEKEKNSDTFQYIAEKKN